MRNYAVALALAGCANAPGGGGADAARGSGDVAVVVTLDGAPAAGVRVVFQRSKVVVGDDRAADAVATDDLATDATGTAVAAMPDGGAVIVVEPPPAATPSRTGTMVDAIAGVAPGDVLHVDVGAPALAAAASNITLTLPEDPAPEVATYELFTTCATSEAYIPAADVAAPLTVLLGNCRDGVADILVATADGSGALIDYLYAPGVAVGSSGGAATQVALRGGYAPVQPVSDVVTDLAATTTAVGGDLLLASPRGVVFDDALDVDVGSGAAAGAALMFRAPRLAGAVADTAIDVVSGDGVFDAQQVERWAPSPATVMPLDDRAAKLADITSLPVFDAARHAVTWSVGAAGATPDVMLAELECRRTAATGSAPVTWFWRVVGPGRHDGDDAAASLALPVLPVAGFDWNPGAADTVVVGLTGGLTMPGGYAAARPLMYAATGIAPIYAANATGTIVRQLALGPVEPDHARSPLASVWRSRLRPDVRAGRADR